VATEARAVMTRPNLRLQFAGVYGAGKSFMRPNFGQEKAPDIVKGYSVHAGQRSPTLAGPQYPKPKLWSITL